MINNIMIVDLKLKEKDFYQGIPGVKCINTDKMMTDEMIQEYIKCSQDPKYFIENYVIITNPDGDELKFKLYDYQDEMLEKIEHNRLNIYLCCRQAGKSQFLVGYVIWNIVFKRNYKVKWLANKLDTAMEMIDRIKFSYSKLPLWLQKAVREFNKTSVTLENGSKVSCLSTTMNSGRGSSVSLLLCVDGNNYITVRNKKTGIIEKIKISQLYQRFRYKYNFIYKTTNITNGKFYIGQHRTNNINDNYFGSGTYIRNCIKKYGKDVSKYLVREILEFCQENELNEKEIYYVNEGRKNKLCMNMRDGGNGGHFSDETIQKISYQAKNSLKSIACRERISKDENIKKKRAAHHIGVKRTEHTRQLQSQRKKDLYNQGINFMGKGCKYIWDPINNKSKRIYDTDMVICLDEDLKIKRPRVNKVKGSYYYVNNGIKERCILKEESIPEGYIKGRLHNSGKNFHKGVKNEVSGE